MLIAPKIYDKFPDGFTHERLSFSLEKGIVKVKLLESALAFEFDPSKVEKKPDVMFLNSDTLGQPAFTWLSDTGESRSGYWESRQRKRIPVDAICLCLLAVDADGQVFVYSLRACEATGFDKQTEVGFWNPKTKVSGGDATHVLLSSKTSSEVLATFASASLKAFIQHMHLKQQTLGKISEPRSIAALEKQVDILASLLLPLLSEDGKKIINQMLQFSSVDSVASAVFSLSAEKEKARKLGSTHQKLLSEIYK